MYAPPIASAPTDDEQPEHPHEPAPELDARLAAVRANWLEVERRRERKKSDVSTINNKIKAASDQRDMLGRNGGNDTEQPAIVLDQIRMLVTRIDKLNDDLGKTKKRHDTRIAEAEQAFKDALFGAQLPLPLTDAPDDPDGPTGSVSVLGRVDSLRLDDGRELRVGGPVMIHGAGAHRPGKVLELDHRGDAKHGHAAVVQYDDDETNTPAHVMAHQLHPLNDDGTPQQVVASDDDGDDAQRDDKPAKSKDEKPPRGKRRRKGAAEDSVADAVAGELEAPSDHEPDPPPPRTAEDGDEPDVRVASVSRIGKPPGLGDRVAFRDDDGHGFGAGVTGTIERMLPGDPPRASVRWTGHDDRLHDHPLDDLRRAGGRKPTAKPRGTTPDDAA